MADTNAAKKAAPTKEKDSAKSATKKTAAKKSTTKKKTSTKRTTKKSNLVIVESPAKAKTISKFLGSGYRVIASNGHIRDLPKSQLGVDVENHFEPKYITLRGRGEVLSNIKKEAKSAKKVYLATDPDREGEAISWHLANVLNIDEKEPCRIVFNEITPKAIKEAIRSPRSIDMDLVDAQQARRILDRLVGYKLSPLLWDKVRRGLSAGRVQSVATRIIVDREEEIKNFKPQEYWTIAAQLQTPKDKAKFIAQYYDENGKKKAIDNEEQCNAIIAAVKKEVFEAKEVKRGEKKRHPAPPFTTSNLQQEAFRKLGFTAKNCMMVAQQLYEGIDIPGRGSVGLVTYIRTDSVHISEDALSAVRTEIQSRYGEAYLPAKANYYKGRKGAQDAHEAIRPTYLDLRPAEIQDALTKDQFKLYRLVYERFVSSQMSDAKFETMSVSIKVGDHDFRASGSRMLFDGFMKIYTEGRDDSKDEKETMLPAMEEGDRFDLKKIDGEQHFTQPPPRYTEASLVKTLEEKGIGRPSTYAPTISTIIDRGYVRREKRVLYPTELGEIITDLMKKNFESIVDLEFTANMEDQLDDIEEGKNHSTDLLVKFYGPFEKDLQEAEKNIEKIQVVDEVSDVPCEKCGAMMVYKMGRFGRFLACPNYPECKNTKAIVQTIDDVPCPKCGAKVVVKRSKRGRTFFGCERYPDCDFVSWDRPAKKACPDCGSLMVHKNSKAKQTLKCTNADCGHVEDYVENQEAAENA